MHDPAGGVPHFTEDFEDYDLSEWGGNLVDTNRLFWTTNARSGTNAIGFRIYPGDYVNGGSRAELSWFHLMPYESEIYIAYSLKLDTNYQDSGQWQIFGQWHDQPDVLNGESWDNFPANSPPVALQYTNYQLGVSVLYQKDGQKIVPLVDYVPGKWIDFTFHIKWSLSDDGFVEGWTNGGKWFDKIYAPTMVNRMGNYLKIGIYRGPKADKTNTVYYDEIRIGSSYSEVQP